MGVFPARTMGVWRMALFEFDEGHLVPAQFGRPVANGLGADVLDAVRAQVLEIVSRPLFPITWRDMSRVSDPSNAAPRLTALDAAGQVVSVEVVAHLDSDTLISSLSRLADTAALSWTDLAREYPGGIDGFKGGWVQFRDSMPPSSASGPRLVMVVGSIDPQVRPALDVLASSGVEVHELSVRQMSNGRVFLEVQAVGPRLYGHVPQVLLGGSGQIDGLTRMSVDAAELPSAPDGTGEDASAAHGRHVGAEAAQDWADTETLFEESYGLEEHADDIDEAEQVDEVQEAAEASDAAAHSSVDTPAPAEEPVDPAVPVLGRDAEGLAALARIVAEEVPLALRPSRGSAPDVLLTTGGCVRVAGDEYTDPTVALDAAGHPGLDGWEEWHLGDDRGPSLAESLAEVNREIVREYGSPQARAAARSARHH